MSEGIYDQFDTVATSQTFRVLQSALCNTNSSNFQKADAATLSMGINLAGVIGLSLNGGTSAAEKDEKFAQFCSSNYSQLKEEETLVQHIKSVNIPLMKEVGKCIASQQQGLLTWIETSRDRKTFSYFIRYVPNGDEKATIKSFDVLPKNVEMACKQRNSYMYFRPNHSFGKAGLILSCPVSPDTTVTLTLLTDKSGSDPSAGARTLDGIRLEEPERNHQFTVDARGYSTASQWLDTGLEIATNANVIISATGSACATTNPDGSPSVCAGPDSTPAADNPGCKKRGIICGALMGKIGADGTPFFIGSSLRKTFSSGGSLFLGYGDTNSEDNSGHFDVKVKIRSPSEAKPTKDSTAAHKTPLILNSVN